MVTVTQARVQLFFKGERVLYSPKRKDRGLERAAMTGTVVAYCESDNTYRIKLDDHMGSQRRVRASTLERLL